MLAPPDQQSLLSAFSELETGLSAVPTSDLASYVSSVLALGGQATGNSGGEDGGGSSSAAAKGRGDVRPGWLAVGGGFFLVVVVGWGGLL